jgi:hypothetical protein
MDSAILGGKGVVIMQTSRAFQPSEAEVRVARLGEDLDEILRLPIDAIVHELVENLGAQLVAAIAAVNETRLVRQWERAERHPQRAESLTAALQATRAILSTGDSGTARSWFVGCSSRLDFVSPLEVIRENTPDARVRIVRAAFGFATQ